MLQDDDARGRRTSARRRLARDARQSSSRSRRCHVFTRVSAIAGINGFELAFSRRAAATRARRGYRGDGAAVSVALRAARVSLTCGFSSYRDMLGSRVLTSVEATSTFRSARTASTSGSRRVMYPSSAARVGVRRALLSLRALVSRDDARSGASTIRAISARSTVAPRAFALARAAALSRLGRPRRLPIRSRRFPAPPRATSPRAPRPTRATPRPPSRSPTSTSAPSLSARSPR